MTQWSAKIRNGNAPYSVHFALPSTANLGRFGRREVTAKNEEMGYDTNPFGKASRRRSRRVPRAPKNGASPPKPKLDLGFDVCARSFGHYPWDDWERHALAHGLDADLAGQARLLIREAYNHGWEGWLQSLCGWSDDGQALLAFALRSPVKARWCFSRLMETDGLRGDTHPKTKEWRWGYLRLNTRRVLSALHNATVNPGGNHAAHPRS